MIKQLLTYFLFAFAFITTSCKKDWNCTCTHTFDDYTVETYSKIEEETKSNAESECVSQSSLENPNYNCELE